MAPFVLRVKGGEDTFFSPLENMHCEEDVSYAWRVSNKVRDALENGSRLENMSWRLWFRHQLLNQQKAAEKAKTEQLQQQQQLQLQQQFNQQQPNSTVSLSVTTTPLHEQHHHQFWFDQHHNPPPPPTKDLPDMMDYDDTNQFMLHNPNDFIFSMPPTKHVEHDNNNNNVQQQQQHEAEHQTPWPLAATEYDLQHTMQDTPTSFQPDHHLDSALASRMAAFSMQPMSMPPSPIMSHMPPMSMHHRPHDAIHNATAAAAVYVEQQQSTNTLLHTTSPPSSSTTLNRLLEQQQQQDTHAHHTHNHHHHHNHHGHPAARVRSRPQISLEIEGMTSSTATNNPSQLYHTHLFSPSVAGPSSGAGDVMPVPQILNLLEQAGMYDGDQPAKFQDELMDQAQQENNNQPQQKNDNDDNDSDDSDESSEDETDDDSDDSDDEEEEEIDDTPICTNCGATSTPLWRRSPEDELLCNACGLYQKLHNAPRPKTLRPNSARKEIREETAVRLVCSNCSTTTTPLWRRDGEGAPLCNACGLYLKLHHEKRPLSMKSDTIKKRQRYEGQRGRNKAGKKKKDKLKKKKRPRKDKESSSKKKNREHHREEKRGRVAYSPTPPAASLPSSPAAAAAAEAAAAAAAVHNHPLPSSFMASTSQLMMNFQQATSSTSTQHHGDPPQHSPFYQDHLFQHSFNFSSSSPSSSTNNDLCDGSCIAGMGAADF